MTDEAQANVTTEAALDRVQESWDRLMVTMSSAPVSEYTTRRDAHGWTSLDHMAHVTAWERSRRHWLLGRPRSEGLGVTPEQFGMDIDALNEIVRAQTADQAYQQIMDDATAGHQQLLDAVMSVEMTARVDSDGITQDEVDQIGVLLIEHLAGHYDEHREYIDRILAG